jgi:hypothetical protein
MQRLWRFFSLALVLSFKLLAADQLSDYAEPNCEESFSSGEKAFQEAVLKKISPLEFTIFLDQKLKAHTNCEVAFSLGAYQAKSLLSQNILMEWMLELHQLKYNLEAINHSGLKKYYQERFNQAFMNGDEMNNSLTDLAFVEKSVQNFLTFLTEKSLQTKKPIPFGRFIFTVKKGLMKLYDYSKDDSGKILFDGDNNPLLVEGNYIKFSKYIWSSVLKNAQEYIDWQPAIFFGTDSFWYGSFWREEGEQSLREVKEDGYFATFTQFYNYAKEMQLDLTEFHRIRNIMWQKSNAYLDRDIQAYSRAKIGVLAAPLIPIAMVAGTAGLATVGITSVASGAATFTLVSSSLAYGSNISAMLALGGIAYGAGLGVYHLIEQYRDAGLPIRVANIFDEVIGGAVSSFPLSAFLPAAVGGLASGGRVLFLSGQTLLSGLSTGLQTVRGLGATGTLRLLPKLPIKIVQMWAQSWWKNKFLFVNFGVDSSVTILFEVISRQYLMEGDSKFIINNPDGTWKFNENSRYTITNSLLINAMAQPIISMKSFIGRFLAYRALGLAAGPIASFTVSGHVDLKRLAFDTMYDSTFSSAFGEFERYVALSSFIQKMPKQRQFALLLVFKMSMKFGKTPLRNLILDAYMHNDKTTGQTFKDLFLELTQMSIDDFSEVEIRKALDTLQTDEYFKKLLNDPSEREPLTETVF